MMFGLGFGERSTHARTDSGERFACTQEPQRSISVLNQRTLEIAPAASRGRQLHPHPQADPHQAKCVVADPSASNKFSYFQSMFNELQIDMGQKEHAIQNLVRALARFMHPNIPLDLS